MTDLSAELLDTVAKALTRKTALVISAGNTKAHILGRDIDHSNLTRVNVAGHRGIVDYHPTELVLTARAGTPITEINATLAREGQTLSFEPPLFNGRATLGGSLASNLSGPGRPWGGSMQDMVLGVQLINGKAQLLNFGGQVMKNVAGYDVSRLQAGALGTLGLITQVSLKVLPTHECSQTLVYEMAGAEALQLMQQRAAQPKPLSGACWVDEKLYLRLSGAEDAVIATAKQWGGEQLPDSAHWWRKLGEFQHNFFAGEAPLWRLSLSATATLDTRPGNTLIDWGGAQRWLRGEQDRGAVEHYAKIHGGHCTLFRGGDRSSEVNHSLNATEKALQLRLKQAFDPAAIFNPGRLYSWM